MQSENSQENQLRQYTLAKQQISDLVRESKQMLEEQKNETQADRCRDLLVKLAEDRFNLAVVGQFKRGKSSLMNAIIGQSLLPTGLLPLTSAITALCYGPKEKITLKRTGWTLDQEIELKELMDYVTEQGNPGNQKGVIEARIELPVPFLRRGLYFVDTPGIGSTRQANTATTYDFLPQADAVIFVTSVEAPLSESEENFLRDIQGYVRRLFVVANKTDLLSPQEQDQVLGYIKAGLTGIIKTSSVEIYPLSARTALQAKLEDNSNTLASSGLPAFEKRLENFLAEEKSNTFLISILDGLADVLENVSDGKEIPALRARVNAFQQELLKGSLEITTREMPELLPPSAAPVEIRKAVETKAAQSLRKTRTCPICDALSRAVFDFFATFQGDLAKDARTRKEFAAIRGFCNLHTWQFQGVASPQDISAGYATLVETVAASLQEIVRAPLPQQSESVAHLLPNGEHCPACQSLRKEQAEQGQRFLDYISTPEGRKFYHQSLGLCLPHLQMVLALQPSEETAEFLLNEQSEHFNDLADDMRSYVLKRDALRRGLLNSNEENAWRRALVQLVGERTANIS
ncbi:MAG: dynamin family protein [Chloroflexi bacterium]|nr:dynamin family protein [Chloroflexota bacterium]